MAYLKNKDVDTLIKIENLIGLNVTNLFGENRDKITSLDDGQTNVCYEDFINYINVIERCINDKKENNIRSNQFNKKNRKYHNIINNIYNARKRNDINKLKFWQNKLKEYKER